MNQHDFNEIDQALHNADAVVSAAEAHGCLCGAVCVLPQFSARHWLRELLPDPAEGELLPESTTINAGLENLYRDTCGALRGADMEFAPLLPDDELPLSERIAALAQWTQGFLYGFGIGAPAAAAEFSEAVTEVLKDLSEIARADEAGTSGSDEEEQAYTELVEYLRAAVQLIYDELVGLRSPPAKALAH
ncbi:MAG: UPF0149 family protein [Steroidobacteraceae bacterium]